MTPGDRRLLLLHGLLGDEHEATYARDPVFQAMVDTIVDTAPSFMATLAANEQQAARDREDGRREV